MAGLLSQNRGSGRSDVVPLAAHDVLANLNLSRGSRFTPYQLAEQVADSPDLAYRAGFLEYIVGSSWRQRPEIGAILELVGRSNRDVLLAALLRAYRARHADLVILDPREQDRNLALYAAHGFSIVDTIIQMEVSRPRPSQHHYSSVAIRAMEEADLCPVLHVERHSFPWLWWNSEAELRWYATIPGVELYVAELPASGVIAYAGFTVLNRQAHLDRMAVHRDYQRQGVARALLAHTLNLMVDRGAQRAALTTQLDNQASQALYKGLGFRESGWRHDIFGLYLRY